MSGKSRLSALLCIVPVLFMLATCILIAGCGSSKEETTTVEREETTETSTPEKATEPKGSEEAEKGTTPEEATPTSSDSSAEEDAVKQVALAAARANNPELPELEVLSVKIVDGWARVDLEPVDKSTDAASAYMKKEDGKWVVFDFGTGIGPDLYPEAPVELFK